MLLLALLCLVPLVFAAENVQMLIVCWFARVRFCVICWLWLSSTWWHKYIFTSPPAAVAKYCDEHVCLSVCLSARISPEPPSIFTNVVSMLPMAVARSYGNDEIPRGRSSFGVFFPLTMHVMWSLQRDHLIANNILQQKGSFCHCCIRWKWDRHWQSVIYDCLVVLFRFRFNRIVARRLKITKFTANRKKH